MNKPENFFANPKLSVIIPSYNEERTVKNVVQQLRSMLEYLGTSFEIIIINDGSTDNTKKEALKTGEKIIDLKVNSGKGNALKVGFQASRGSHILTLDSDGSHSQEDIKLLVQTYSKSDVHMLIGSRFLNTSRERFTTPTNIVGNKVFKFLFYFISGNYITDSQSGLRIFSKSILSFINIESRGYEIESELTAKSVGLGFKVQEVPILCKPRLYGASSLHSIRDGFKIVKTLIFSYIKTKNRLNKSLGVKKNENSSSSRN